MHLIPFLSYDFNYTKNFLDFSKNVPLTKYQNRKSI